MTDASRPEDKLPQRPQSGQTRTDLALADAQTRARAVPQSSQTAASDDDDDEIASSSAGHPPEADDFPRPPRPPLPPERTTVSAPMLTADESADSSVLFSNLTARAVADNDDEKQFIEDADGSDEGDAEEDDADDEADGFVRSDTEVEVPQLAADQTRVTLPPTAPTADRTIVAPMDLGALRDPPQVAKAPAPTVRRPVPDDVENAEEGDDFDAPTISIPDIATASKVERTGKIASLATVSSAELPVEQPIAKSPPEVTTPEETPALPAPFSPPPTPVLIAFGIASLLILVAVGVYACG